MTVFSQRLLQLNKENGVTQKEVADAIGTSPRNFQRYLKNDQEPSLHLLVAMADYFNVSMDYLAGRTDVPKYIPSESKKDS